MWCVKMCKNSFGTRLFCDKFIDICALVGIIYYNLLCKESIILFFALDNKTTNYESVKKQV